MDLLFFCQTAHASPFIRSQCYFLLKRQAFALNMERERQKVAIIGAGLAGLCLALALNEQNIACAIYESRSESLNIGGAIMLSPNSLRILAALGIYERIRDKGYDFDTVEYRDITVDTVETHEFGSEEKYGFKALRIYRHIVIDELLAMLSKKGVRIEYGMKFKRIVTETKEGVSFELADGSQKSASLLVGSDGIHSMVRKYLYPDLTPKFTGIGIIGATVPTTQLKLPPGYHLPVTLMSRNGAFVIAPQDVDCSEVMIAKQKRFDDPGPAGWDAIQADKQSMIEFLQEDSKGFPQLIWNGVSKILPDNVGVWPFYTVPRLDRWISPQQRVIIVGDAAHAIPPPPGQGTNQAFEDVYMFVLLLAQARKVNMQKALTFWQSYRQGRVDAIMELTKQINLRRMPKEEGRPNELEEFKLDWLYAPDLKVVVDKWVADECTE